MLKIHKEKCCSYKDKTKLFVFHPSPHVALSGEFPDPVFSTMTPVVVWEKIEFFYKNKDVLRQNSQFDFENQSVLNECVLPFYIREGVVQTNYKDFIIVDGRKLKKFFSFIDFSNFLSVDKLESFGNVKLINDDGVVDEKVLLSVVNKYLQRCNEIVDIMHKIDSQKFLLPSPVQINKVKPKKFITAKAKGVGFGNANYIVYDDKSLMIDFGGLNYSKRDFSDFTMCEKENFIVLTHWHIDHYCNFSYLDFSQQKPVHFICPTEFYGLAELYVIFHMAQFAETVNFIIMDPNYADSPKFAIDEGIFVYGSNYADTFFQQNDSKGNNQMYIDFNSSCLFIVNPIGGNLINLYSGDQKYKYISPALEKFNEKYKIDAIDLLHATHHGLLAAPVANRREALALTIKGLNIKGNVAFISNDFDTFKENYEHKMFLQDNFKNVFVTYYNDIIASYNQSSVTCEVLVTDSNNDKKVLI